MQKYGWFSPPEFTSKGDPYLKKGANQDSRYKGQQMTMKPPLKGKGVEVTFSKPLRLFEGENYVTLTQFKNKERARMARELKERPGYEAFRPPNPGKSSTGPGTFHGTFAGKVEYQTDGRGSRRPEYGKREGLPNILTAPSKQGSYGTAGITLGKYGTGLGNKGIVNEYVYTTSPYDGARQLEIAKRAADREARKNQEPFKPTNPPKKGTYGTPGTMLNSAHFMIVKETRGVCGEYEYKIEGPAPRKSDRRPGEGAPEGKDPFKPPAPPKSGKGIAQGRNCATLAPFTEWLSDPFELKESLHKAQMAAEKSKRNQNENFRPSSFPKSLPTRSVFRMNIK